MKRWIVIIVMVCLFVPWPGGCFKPLGSAEVQVKKNFLNDGPAKSRNMTYLLSDMPKTFNTLILLAVGGAIFAMAAKTKIGWAITGASIGGMSLMVTFAKYADWISYGVMGTGVLLIITKATRLRNVAKLAIIYGQNLKEHLPADVIKKVNKTAHDLQPTEIRSEIKKIKND